jgi:nicotinate-nucleotide adenylyltransferase
MPRICYGGTFDPVHKGHLAIASAVADALAEPVWMLPAADPPHRPPPGASAEQRALMLDLAIACDGRLRVDRRELRRQGPSYTVDTLRELRRECGPHTPIVWVLGIDALHQLDTWHHWRELFEHAHLLGVERPGAPVGADWLHENAPAVAAELERRRCEPAGLLAQPAGRFAELAIQPLRPESGTEVRSRIAGGGDWQALVPPAVACFIRQQGLYGTAGAGAGV